MSKVTAENLKANDFIKLELPALPGIRNNTKLYGMIQLIKDYPISGKIYKYITILTEKGLQATYLQFTDEVIKEIITDEETKARILKHQMRNLPRTCMGQGSDPEIFIVDKNNVVIPSFLFLGSKEQPNRIHETNQPLFWDGFQAEFNIPGGTCLDGSLTSTFYGLRTLNLATKKYDETARLTILPTLDIPPHMLVENKEEHVQFGCMPSKNVYNMEGKKTDGRNVPFRSAGGHIHLQLDAKQKTRIPEYVRALDAILGVACVSLFGQFDDVRRREYYGLAGEYRTPAHGMEYRVLSNVWMASPTTMYIVYELARKVISLVDAGLFKHWKADELDVIECINECNVPLACMLIDDNAEMFKDILKSFCYKDPEIVQVVYTTFMTGIESLIPDVDNVEYNWRLDRQYPDMNNYRISNMRFFHDTFKKLLEVKL